MKTFNELLEDFKNLTPEKEERVNAFLRRNVNKAKELASENQRLSRKPFSKFRPNVQKQKSELAKKANTLRTLSSNAVDALTKTSVNRQAAIAHKINNLKNQLGDLEGRNNVRRFQRNDVEYVFDYLIDEGFTDSYESAMFIVEAMSDEWFEDLIETWIRKDPWEVQMRGHDNYSPAGRAVGRAMNAANRGGVRELKPSTLANMERQARRLESRNAKGYNNARAIRAMARHLTKTTPNQRKANWFANRQDLAG